MLDVKTTLPRQLSPKNIQVTLGLKGIRFYVSYERYGQVHYFLFDSRLLFLLIILFGGILVFDFGKTPATQVTHVYHYIPTKTEEKAALEKDEHPPAPPTKEAQPLQGTPIVKASNFPTVSTKPKGDLRGQFIQEKQRLIYEFTTQHSVVQTAQLSDEQLLNLNRELSELFKELVLKNLNIHSHVYQFFTDTSELNKLNTALVEQDKYHVPASITLAQAALESSYGRKVKGNNYFGIKDKKKKTSKTTTTEYYTAEELAANAYKVMSKKKVRVKGKLMYKCTIKDYFQQYSSAWESFRAHSVYLNTNPRYAPLFTGGKNYTAWADKIGSMKQGGVGYATDPIYGNLIKKIIKRYHLDLLDH